MTLTELDHLYQARLTDFARVATAIAGNVETGLDAVHDAFVACVRNIAAYRGDGSLEAWVWRAVVNSALRKRRDSRPVVAVGDDHGHLDSCEPQGWEDLESIRKAVGDLPERQRLVLFLRYYADLDYQAIADALDIKIGTVGAALNAAHTSLRVSLSKEVLLND